MISVTKFVVRSYVLDHFDLFWEIPDTAEEIEGYDFFVLRSVDGAAGPYRQLAGPFYNTFTFRDTAVQSLSNQRVYYYKIRVVKRATGDSQEFGPEWLRAKPDLITLEVVRRETLVFQEFNGRLTAVFPRLTFGQRCAQCWDLGPKQNSIFTATQQNCLSCFDTTYVGGYATPMGIFVQVDPSTEETQKTETSEEQFKLTTGRASSFPPLKAKDILVEAENVRWLINKVTPTEKLRAVVRQELQLWRLPKDDINYRLPVDFDLLREHSPARAFKRRMSLQAEQYDAVPDLVEEQ